MSHEIEIYLNELPFVTGAGWYHVDTLWKHVDRKVPIHVLIFVLEGTFYVTEEGIDYEVPKNHMIILKANKQQTAYKYMEPGAHWLWVNFQEIKTSKVSKETMTIPKVMVFGRPHTLELGMKKILEIERSKEPFKQQQVNGSLYRLFMLMMVQAQMGSSEIYKKSLGPKVIEILKRQVSDVFDSKEIAKELDLNYSYISRKFKEETGETVKGFYQTLKVNEAILLFQSTNMNVAEISHHLNYPNPYQFSRVFKQIKGVPPSAYRKQLY